MHLKVYNMDVLKGLRQISDHSVDTVMTSPPYYGLRDYETKPSIWGDSDCEHQWVEFMKKGISGGMKSGMLHRKETENFQLVPDTQYSVCQKCNAWMGELGREPIYWMYVEHMLLITAELRRILKKDGLLFINMGDTFRGQGSPSRHIGTVDPKYPEGRSIGVPEPQSFGFDTIRPKSLMMIPERIAMGMIDQGWVLRNKIVWYSRNKMPSPKKDALVVKHEDVYEFTLEDEHGLTYFFSQSGKYFFNLNENRNSISQSDKDQMEYRRQLGNKQGYDTTLEIAEQTTKDTKEMAGHYAIQPRTTPTVEYRELPDLKEFAKYINDKRKEIGVTIDDVEEQFGTQAPHHWFNGESFPSVDDYNALKELLDLDNRYDEALTTVLEKSSEKQTHPKGANPGDVWDIPLKGYRGKHYAAYPEALVQRALRTAKPYGVVLDPFAGSGTTLKVALDMSMDAIGIDIQPDYIEQIKDRTGWNKRIDATYELIEDEELKRETEKQK